MTENKRFTITQDFEEHHKQIRDNGHIIMGCFIEQQAEVIVNLLNKQHEQIERLKGNFRALDEVKCELADENEQLKQYKQSLNDVLKSWSQKNLTAKQLQVVLAIMEELNVIGDV